MKDVPDPSERCTTTMSASGSFRPGLADAMRASLHFVIFPRKMSASTSGVNRSVSFTSGRLYVGTSPPRTVGMCSTLPLIAAMAESFNGASVAPRSEEHTSELQSRLHLVCRLLLEKKKKLNILTIVRKQTETI